MAFNFSDLNQNPSNTVLHPREIFSVLPNKDTQFQYPRDVQTHVWNQWFARRKERDNIIKMNTGSGKTSVALMILQSCLNEGVGPAVYIAPDQYLVQQVVQEAGKLGIETSTDKDSVRFLKGREILVTTVKTLVNGQSVFGVGEVKKDIGSIVVDDAHACLESIESQYTFSVSGKLHDQILEFFKDDLRKQSEATAMEVEQHQPNRFMLVPFWAWQAKKSQVMKLIQMAGMPPKDPKLDVYGKDTRDAIAFNYQLIKECFAFCRCAIGCGAVEISPDILPVSVIPSFANARRRIFLSATLSEDGVLVSHFDIAPNAITQAITPETAGDIGDRMIIIPQELNPTIADDELKAFYKKLAAKHNVIVIVPSNYRAGYWADTADLTLRADNLQEGVRRLKNREHVGLVVFVNKYDGIDLPKSACDVLVVDGLPDVRRGIDKIEDAVLFGTNFLLSKRIQRIEQGMGRGVRSSDDFCLVFLMGKTLTNHLYRIGAKAMFSVATKAQLTLSEKATEPLANKPLSDIEAISQAFLQRDRQWVAAAKGALVHLKYPAADGAGLVVRNQRDAFGCALRGDVQGAAAKIEEAANATQENLVKGWLKLQVATYLNVANPVAAQEVLQSAIGLNSRITKPLAGISYSPLRGGKGSQGQRSAEHLQSYADENAVIMDLESVLAQLAFQPETADAFEEAMKAIGRFIGFASERPESEAGQGPDVLWEVGNGQYFVIECKNGVTSDNPINKHDCNQLNGSAIWFKGKFPATSSAIPIMVHPQITYEHAASLEENARIWTPQKLEEFKEVVRQFIRAAKSVRSDPTKVTALLRQMRLAPADLSRFLSRPRRKTG